MGDISKRRKDYLMTTTIRYTLYEDNAGNLYFAILDRDTLQAIYCITAPEIDRDPNLIVDMLADLRRDPESWLSWDGAYQPEGEDDLTAIGLYDAITDPTNPLYCGDPIAEGAATDKRPTIRRDSQGDYATGRVGEIALQLYSWYLVQDCTKTRSAIYQDRLDAKTEMQALKEGTAIFAALSKHDQGARGDVYICQAALDDNGIYDPNTERYYHVIKRED